jgi:4'-phosphopantetheinyl transferase
MAKLTQTAETLLGWRAVLSDEERARADRFHRTEDRLHFVASHAILRFLLAAYANRPPEALAFGREEFGKPFLLADGNPVSLTFNLSHSGELALFGFARGRRTGVDIEHIRPHIWTQDIFEYALTPSERAMLQGMAKAQQPATFFALWTGKEAYLKACGCGLGGNQAKVKSFRQPTDFRPGMSHEIKSEEGAVWTIYRLIPAVLYSATVVAEGAGVRFISHWWGPQAAAAGVP